VRDRFRRFLHLERARPDRAATEPAAPPPARERFGAVDAPRSGEARAGPGPAPGGGGANAAEGGGRSGSAGGHLDRFRAAAERAPEAGAPAPEVQPFTRCAACETDNSRYAGRCTTCDADLGTEAQRLFNARLWAGRLEERAREQAAHAERAAAARAAGEEAARARRGAAEILAREVGAQERRRLDAELGADGFEHGGVVWGRGRDGGGAGGPPLRARVLWLWQDPRWRAVLAAVAGGLVLGAVALARSGSPKLLVLLLALGLALSGALGGRRRRGRWRLF
jgi:hypothetical protein